MAAAALANGQHDGRQLIDKAALQSAHVPAIVRSVDPTTGAAAFYGFGWNVDYREHGVEWSHAGAFSAGARTLVHLIPGEQLGVAILSNAFPTGVPEGIAATFFDLVFKGEPARDWVALANEVFEAGYKEMMKPSLAYATPPASPAASLPASAYVGDYSNDYVGDAKVVDSGGRSSCFSGRRASASRSLPSIATCSSTTPWRKRPRRGSA